MNSEVQKKTLSITSKKVAIISLVTFTLLMLAIAAQLSYVILVYDKVYKGVYINNLNAGGMNKTQLTDTLKKTYADRTKDTNITLKAGDITREISLKDLNVSYDIDIIVDKAYYVGRTGNMLERLKEISTISKKTLKLDLTSTFDKGKVQTLVNDIYNKTLIEVKNLELIIQPDKVILHSGHKGRNIDKEQATEEIEKAVMKNNNEIINLKLFETEPTKMSVEEYYNLIHQEPKDAEAKVTNNTVTYEAPLPGRTIDKAALSAAITELGNTENAEKVLPVKFTQAQLDITALKALVFKDTLQTFSTQFYTGSQNDYNRGENIKLSVAEINGTILAPGESFSFNDVVGQRTEDRGFKVAHAYSDGKVIDDVGGGICQVSSTLFNAVVFADLKIADRTNHMFTIGYLPLGQDAAVSFGAPDFKFTNTTNWPIKVEGWVTKDNQIHFSLKGTNEAPGKTIDLEHKTVKTLDFITKYIDDPTMLEGDTYIKQYGATGYVIDTFKITKQDGQVIKEEKLYTSTYTALTQEVVIGTKKQ